MMDLERIAPELHKPVKAISRMPVPLNNRLGRAIIRRLGGVVSSTLEEGVSVEHVHDADVYVFRPAQCKSSAALLWIHGGGYVLGSPKQDYALCSQVAAELGVVVVATAYRLSPEHPFPAPLDDCHAAWNWMIASADSLGIDKNRIAVGGQSAGGGLAAGLVHRLHDEGGVQPVAQWLLCPMIDDRTATDRNLDAVGHRVWNNRLNRIGWTAYLGREPGGADVPPLAAPARRTDLSGLPPAFIGVGSVDLFVEEDRVHAERLRAAGVPCEYLEVEGAPHGFEAWASETRMAKDYLAEARRWLAGHLS